MKNQDLAKKIKELRIKKGLSQEQLGENSGLSLRTIQRIENGETIPRGDSLKKLAAALHVSPDEILDWQLTEDNNVLYILNLSQLGIIAFPFLGVIIPMAIWILKKETIKNVNEQGISILNFQISWLVLAVPVFLLGLLLGGPQMSILFILLFYIFNIISVLINLRRVKQSKEIIYRPRFAFLK